MEVGRSDREQQGVGSVAVASGTMTGHAMTFIDGFASGNISRIVLRHYERCGRTNRECDGKQQSNVDRHEAPFICPCYPCRENLANPRPFARVWNKGS